jgi:long-chain fatty acid transport protein
MRGEYRPVWIWLMVPMFFSLFPSFALGDIGPALSGLTGSANDATSVFFSPAGITRLDRPELVVQTAFVYANSKFDVDSATFGGGNGDNDQQVSVIPGLFYVHPYNERLSFGVSVNIPSGMGYDFGKQWSGRYHVTETSLAFVAGTGVAAYKVTDKLSLAAGPYVMYVDSVSKARVNNPLPSYSDGHVKLEEDGADIGFTLGVMYEFTDSTRIGANYRSELNPDLDGTPTFHNLDPLLRETLAAADLLGTEVVVDFTIPALFQVGFYTEFADQWSMTGDLTWLDMSEFGITHVKVEKDSISVQSTFKDMWAMTTGLRYAYGENRAVSVGGLYATSPIKDSNRDIGLPLDRIIGGGVGYEMPFFSYLCRLNLNYFDLGDGDVSQEGGPLTGDFEGSFGKNWAVMLDLQFRKIF